MPSKNDGFGLVPEVLYEPLLVEPKAPALVAVGEGPEAEKAKAEHDAEVERYQELRLLFPRLQGIEFGFVPQPVGKRMALAQGLTRLQEEPDWERRTDKLTELVVSFFSAWRGLTPERMRALIPWLTPAWVAAKTAALGAEGRTDFEFSEGKLRDLCQRGEGFLGMAAECIGRSLKRMGRHEAQEGNASSSGSAM